MLKVADMLAAGLCFCLCLLAVFTQRLDLYEGDICKQEGSQLWSCQKISKCTTAVAELKKGRRPVICSFSQREPIVCCQPARQDSKLGPTPTERISKQKCREYGKSVYVKVENPMSDGYTEIDTCAAGEPLITNGKSAEPREFPHMALIGYGSKNNIKWLCGGSLISERFVLSAAHCTNAGEIGLARWVRLGDYNIFSTKDDENRDAEPREYEIIERINHPGYKYPSLYNDIALYRLKDNVIFNEYVRPICLQTDHTFPKSFAIGTGWGRTVSRGGQSAILQKANLTIIGRKECSEAYKALKTIDRSFRRKFRNGIQDSTQLCAGDKANGKDTCHGDSGGPLQIRLTDPYCMYSQVGVISFGTRICTAPFPGIFTRVSSFVPWIESVVWS